MAFCPDYLRVEEGSFVEWTLFPENENYQSKAHVIAFDTAAIESDCLKMGECSVFKEQFNQTGVFPYRC